MIRSCWILAFCTLLMGARDVSAHFLFVRIMPPAEGGRHAEVYFSDRADAGDSRFIENIAHTRLWAQTSPGKFTPLTVHKSPDRLRVLLPSSGSLSVVGECTYGVLARPKQPAFLLRHYPKAIAGNPEGLQAKTEIPFEIQVRAAGEGLEFTAMRNGKPVPLAKFFSVGADLQGHTFTADTAGKAAWRAEPRKGPGYYAVYTSQTLKESGIHQGQKYEEIREFTTLAFSWPMQAKGADTEAVKLFQEAMAARASWHDFPGFSAEITAQADGRSWKGSAAISAKGEVELSKEDDLVAPWVRDQLESMVLHRISRSQTKPVLRFADGDQGHPLGRLLIFEGGKFASSYRVKDQQILVVNRLLDKVNMTITVLDNDRNAEMKFLPRSYTVQYWDAANGNLQRTETIQNRWTRLGAWDLPTQLTVITASGSGQGVKTMSLGQHRLLK